MNQEQRQRERLARLLLLTIRRGDLVAQRVTTARLAAAFGSAWTPR